MAKRRDPSPEALAAARPFIEASVTRSPCGNSVEAVLAALQSRSARLWSDEEAALVSQFVASCRVSLDERVWHGGGDMEALGRALALVADASRGVGCNRVVIEGTRKGWERVLSPHGFRKFDGLELLL